MQKLGSRHDQPTNWTPTQLVAQLATHDDSHVPVEGKTPEKSPKVNLLTEVRELKAELAAIQEGMEQQSHASPPEGAGIAKDKEGVSIASIVSIVVMLATSVTNA